MYLSDDNTVKAVTSYSRSDRSRLPRLVEDKVQLAKIGSEKCSQC